MSAEPEITKEEQELLQFLQEDLALPPLPPDFVSNVLARLGIPSDAPLIEDDTELAISAPSSDTLEELFQRGRDAVEKRNHNLAVETFRRAAEQGHALAQLYLGVYYFDGWTVAQDYTEAVWWFRRAAQQGNEIAAIALGYMYNHGLGMPKDYDEADKWIHIGFTGFLENFLDPDWHKRNQR